VNADLGAWGIDAGYWDTSGTWREPSPEALRAIAEAVGAGDGSPPPGAPLWFVRAGSVEYLRSPCSVVLEDGTTLPETDVLPPDLPPGYHQLEPGDGGPTTRLVVTPGRCHLPPDLRAWGWAVQLYAARSRSSWGIGDLADLRSLARWSSGEGASVLAVSPLHAPSPGPRQEASPYYASSRRFLNPLHLRVEEVPGASEVGVDLDRLATAGRALLRSRQIDRDQVWALKREALERCFSIAPEPAPTDPALHEWATFCALAEVHGDDWREWPARLRHPGSSAVKKEAARLSNRVAFHTWLQARLDDQLRDAATDLALVNDLAVGFDPAGADAWAFQDMLAMDARIGAPPDAFNPDGQDWGLPPFVPWRLRNAGYLPFVEAVRAAFRHAGGLRVDHVMGLFRLFWVPPGGSPETGTYVRYTAGELLDLLALESWRAKAFVVGEDLGTVEDGVRPELSERQILSYRLLWFEPGPPETWPARSLAAVTTHDLPTTTGLWTGADPAAANFSESRERLQDWAGLDDDATAAEAVLGAHRAIARTHSAVVLATLDDACLVRERPNVPGTQDDTNWCRALPCTIEDLMVNPLPLAISDTLGG
jgi:4-alpha-glucanotransferase